MTPRPPAADYPRDLVGYGARPPHPRWPGGARIAVQFVLNYEEGAESSVLHGDAASETFLSEIVGAQAVRRTGTCRWSRCTSTAARAGVWRVLRLFARARLPLTVFGVAMALERNPAVVGRVPRRRPRDREPRLALDLLPAALPEAVEREHIERAVATILTRLTGAAPLGWYTGRDSPNTRRLVCEHGGFLYDADSYADDLPYWTTVDHARRRCATWSCLTRSTPTTCASPPPQGFNSGEQFFAYLRDAFDVLYAEGDRTADAPKMLSIGLHAASSGGPARSAALARFLDHVRAHDGRVGRAPRRHRAPLARHASVRRRDAAPTLNALDRGAFVAALGAHLRAFAVGRGARVADRAPVRDHVDAACGHGRRRSRPRRRTAARADPRPSGARGPGRHPRRADGRHRRAEQAGAGLIGCTPAEFARSAAQRALQRALRLSVHPRGEGLRSRRRHRRARARASATRHRRGARRSAASDRAASRACASGAAASTSSTTTRRATRPSAAEQLARAPCRAPAGSGDAALPTTMRCRRAGSRFDAERHRARAVVRRPPR